MHFGMPFYAFKFGDLKTRIGEEIFGGRKWYIFIGSDQCMEFIMMM